MTNSLVRNFNCPETGDSCIDPGCTKENCIAQYRAREEARRAEELARQGRIRRGEATLDDLDL